MTSPQPRQSEVVYEVVGTTNHRGWLHGRDHISADAGDTTLCGLRNRRIGGRSDIHCLQGDPYRGYTSWTTAFQCLRCEVARRRLGVPARVI